MPKDITLRRVEHDIADGNLGKARDRLHGLVDHYPDDLSLRRRLGDVYFQLQYLDRAGCYWYLEKHKNEEMQRACDAYVQSKGGDPLLILKGLRIGCNPESFPTGYARDVLISLKSKAPGYRFPGQVTEKVPFPPKTFRSQIRDAAMLWGCAVVAFIAAMIFLAGIFTLVMWARGYDFQRT
jgi:hypothetical protein